MNVIPIKERWVAAAVWLRGEGDCAGRKTLMIRCEAATGVGEVVIKDANKFKERSSSQWEKEARGNGSSKFVTLNSFTDAASKT